MISAIFERTAVRNWRAITALFFTTTFLEALAQGHIDAFTPLYLRDSLNLSPDQVRVWTGLLSATSFGIAFPLAPFWGAVAERYSRKLVIVRSQYIEAIAYVLVALAPDLPFTFFARLLLGFTFGNIAVVIAAQTLLTPDRRMASGIAVVQAANPVAVSLGPPLGALLLPLIGLRGLFFLDGAGCLLAALLITFLMPEPPHTGKRQSVIAGTRNAATIIWRRPTLRWNFVAWYLTRGAQQVVNSYLPVRLTELSGPNPADTIGFVLGVYGALTSIGTWLTGRFVDRVGPARLFWPAMVLATGTVLGTALAPWLWLVTLTSWVRAIPVALTGTVLYAHLAQVLTREERAPVLSFTPFPRNFGTFSVPLLAAPLGVLGAGPALIVGAVAYGTATLVGWRLLVETRRLGAQEREAPHSETPP